jgi:hypothetical protein
MKLQMTKISFLLLFGAFASEGASPSPSATAGAKYQHKMENSNFKLGAGERAEVEGPYERFVGEIGSFMIDTVTGATLAVRNPPQSGVLPRPLTQDPTEHSEIVQDYLLGAGVPANEVSGTHVTTTMGGGGPRTSGVQPLKSTLLWYTTHLERSLQGIPVEGSFAFAGLDSAGEVITEGVYWPAIPANVVSKAQALKQKLDSPTERAAFLANVAKARPDAKEAAGEVKIVHTSAGHHGDFEARAVYSAVVRSPNRGKAQLVRFDDTGAPVVMADERPSGNDSVKRQ